MAAWATAVRLFQSTLYSVSVCNVYVQAFLMNYNLSTKELSVMGHSRVLLYLCYCLLSFNSSMIASLSFKLESRRVI